MGLSSPEPTGRERDRYRREDLRERLTDLVGWFPAHRTGSTVIAIIVTILLVMRLVTPSIVHLAELRVGDCLFVLTSSSGDVGPSARPAGEPLEVRRILATSGAERAPCDGSHSHEVSAVVDLGRDAAGPYPGEGALTARAEATCADAFASYVGHPQDGSAFDTVPVVPVGRDWASGARTAVCLVYARSGAFLDRPARASGG